MKARYIMLVLLLIGLTYAEFSIQFSVADAPKTDRFSETIGDFQCVRNSNSRQCTNTGSSYLEIFAPQYYDGTKWDDINTTIVSGNNGWLYSVDKNNFEFKMNASSVRVVYENETLEFLHNIPRASFKSCSASSNMITCNISDATMDATYYIAVNSNGITKRIVIYNMTVPASKFVFEENLTSTSSRLSGKTAGNITVGDYIVFDATGKSIVSSRSSRTDGMSVEITRAEILNVTFPITIDPDLILNNTNVISIGGNVNYTSIVVRSGGNLVVNATGWLNLTARVNITVETGGMITGASGYDGGAGADGSGIGFNGTGLGNGTGGHCNGGGGGGGGFGGAGGIGGNGDICPPIGGNGGAAYDNNTNRTQPPHRGSGGGGGGTASQGGAGGAGGSGIFLSAPIINITGGIFVNGTNGTNVGTGSTIGGGGGGAGGSIILLGNTVDISNGKIYAFGGNGGSGWGGGGGGGGGRIKIFANTYLNGSSDIRFHGGVNGANGIGGGGASGSSGTYYNNTCIGNCVQGNLFPNIPNNLSANLVSPQTYAPDRFYKFNATACDNDGVADISTVFFQLNNINNSVTESSALNATCNYYSFNLSTGLGAGVNNITWYVSDLTSSSNSTTTTFTVLQENITIVSSSINDTYVTFNESVNIIVTASAGAAVFVEALSNNGLSNYTTSLMTTTGNISNYSVVFSRSNLGVNESNSTQVNITNIYFSGGNYTNNRSVSALTFGFATTTLVISASPNPAVTGASNSVTFIASWLTGDATSFGGGTCSITFNSTTSAMSYNSLNVRYEASSSMAGVAVGNQIWAVNCTNTTYQDRYVTDTLAVNAVGGGGNGGGGGGGGSNVIIVDGKPTCISGQHLVNDTTLGIEVCKPIIPELSSSRVAILTIVLILVGILYITSQNKSRKHSNMRSKNNELFG